MANVTRRDAAEFLAIAAELPIRTEATRYPVADADAALADLADGRLGAPTAVLTIEEAKS